jgi:hypothetical protein
MVILTLYQKDSFGNGICKSLERTGRKLTSILAFWRILTVLTLIIKGKPAMVFL